MQGSLKPAVVHRVGETKPGDVVKFDLMRVEKGAVTAFRVSTLSDGDVHSQHMHASGCPHYFHPDVCFNKLAVAREASGIISRERSELTEMLESAISCGEQDMVTHIETCMRKLDAHEAAEAAAGSTEEDALEHDKDSTASPVKASSSVPSTPTTPMSRSSSGLSQPDRGSASLSRSSVRSRWWEDGELYEEGWSSVDDDYYHDEDVATEAYEVSVRLFLRFCGGCSFFVVCGGEGG